MAERRFGIRLGIEGDRQVEQTLDRVGQSGNRALSKIEQAGRPASRGLLAVNDATNELRQSLDGAAARLGPLGAAMRALGPAGTAAAAGIAGIALATVAALRRSREAARRFTEIGDAAERLGVGVEAFQELTFAAAKYGVEQDQVIDGLKELNSRVDEFVATASGGPANEAFRRLGFSREGLAEISGDVDRVFTEVVQRIEEIDSAAARTRIAEEIFGDEAGQRVLQFVGRLEAARVEARDLGIVIDESVIRNAAEMNRQLEISQQVIDRNLDQALIDLAPLLVNIAEAASGAAQEVRRLSDGFKTLFDDLESASTAGLREELERIDAAIKRQDELLEEMERVRREGGLRAFLQSLPLGIAGEEDINENIARLVERRAEITAILRQRDQPDSGGGGGESPVSDQEARTLGEIAEAEGRTAGRGSGVLGIREAGGFFDQPAVDVEALRESRQAIEQRIAAMREEADVLRLRLQGEEDLARAMEIRNSLSEEERAAFDDRRDEIMAAIRAERELTETMEKQDAVARGTAQAFGSFTSTIISGSESAGDAVADLTQRLIDLALQVTVLDPLTDSLRGFVSGLDLFGGSSITPPASAGASGSLGFGTGSSPALATSAQGNIFSKPAFTSVSEFGHPEAVLPLRRLPSGDLGVQAGGGGKDGAQMNVFIEPPTGMEAEARRQANGNGGEDLYVTFVKMGRRAIGEGAWNKPMRAMYGINPQPGSR